MDLTCSQTFEPAGASHARALPRRPWLKWVAPDLALALSFLTLFYCLFLFQGHQKLFRDSDAGWHIRIGESILDGNGLPRTDPYSLLRNGQPWFAWEWGADALTGAVHQAAGLTGVALLYSAVIAVCTWLWFRLHWAVGGSFLLACAMTTLMLSTANLHWLARPHVFSWALLLGAVLFLESVEVRPVHALLATFYGGLWANVHASFFLAPALVGIYVAACLIRPLIWRVDRASEWRRAKVLALIGAAAALGTFFNPYGWRLHEHVFLYLTNAELLDRIGEFQSFNFHAEGSLQILLALGIAAVGGVAALAQGRLAHTLLAVVFIAMALRSARALPLVALLILPLANGAMTSALEYAGGLQPALRRRLDGFLRYGTNLRIIDSRLGGFALIPAGLLLAFLPLKTPSMAAGFPASDFPVQAAGQIEKLGTNIRLLAPDKFGGYLIYRFEGKLKVYFDGRSDFYGAQYMKDYLSLIEVRQGWYEQVERIGFTHALLPNRYSLIPALEREGWKKLCQDGTATLLAKR